MFFLLSKIFSKLYFFEEKLLYRYIGLSKKNSKNINPDFWDMKINKKGHLSIQDCDAVNLADLYGTPLYLVDQEKLKKNYYKFYNSFAKDYPKIEVYSSYKTNPIPNILKILHDSGAGAEVISPFELWLALKLDVPPEKIIFNGPCKTDESLYEAVANNIRMINIDNIREIQAIEKYAAKCGHLQNVGIRVITSVGWSGQFGFSIKNGSAFSAFEKIKRSSHLNPCGLHFHLGTGIKDKKIYLQAVNEVLKFAKRIKEKLGIEIRYFDLGGGFGIPSVKSYSEKDQRLFNHNIPAQTPEPSDFIPLDELGEKINCLFRKYYGVQDDKLPTIIFEPGRALTGSAQILLLKVIALKQNQDVFKIAIVDGGKNIAIPTSWEYHEAFIASKMDSTSDECYKVFGPLCHPQDLLFPAKVFPKLEEGDVMAIMDAGAYFVPNQRNFSFPRPSVVLVNSGKHEKVRERESFENIVSMDKF